MTTAAAKPAHDRDWLPILKRATQEVFEIMLGCQVESIENSELSPKGGFTSIVGIAGALCGVVTVRCAAETANLIAKTMLGETTEFDEQAVDAMGEMCNMIAGNFKNKLAGTDERCMLSVPSVISGGEYKYRSLVHGPPIETIVSFQGSAVAVCLQLKG